MLHPLGRRSEHRFYKIPVYYRDLRAGFLQDPMHLMQVTGAPPMTERVPSMHSSPSQGNQARLTHHLVATISRRITTAHQSGSFQIIVLHQKDLHVHKASPRPSFAAIQSIRAYSRERGNIRQGVAQDPPGSRSGFGPSRLQTKEIEPPRARQAGVPRATCQGTSVRVTLAWGNHCYVEYVVPDPDTVE